MTELRVCIGSSCHLKGSYNVVSTFQQLIEEEKLHSRIVLKTGFCMKECGEPGVMVSLDGQPNRITPDHARDFFYECVLPRLALPPERAPKIRAPLMAYARQKVG
jgi:NADH:ubiquinone oxidoreductase subunit E